MFTRCSSTRIKSSINGDYKISFNFCAIGGYHQDQNCSKYSFNQLFFVLHCFLMVSSTIFIFIFLISQCVLVISNGLWLRNFQLKSQISPIPLSELIEELHHESLSFLYFHVTFMVLAASYGDRLYEVSKDLSAECSRTFRASYFMLEKLAISEEMRAIMDSAISDVQERVRNTEELEEHPLEVYCRKAEKEYAANSNLSALFEKAKKMAANFENVSRRPPYSRVLIKSNEALELLAIDRLVVAEFARLAAHFSFIGYLHIWDRIPSRMNIFVNTCLAVAKKEIFTDSIQSLYERTLNDTVPEITVNDRFQKFSSMKDDVLFWVPKMMKVFYSYIVKDPIMKKEVDSVAATIFAKARNEDLDFSKF